MAIAGSAIGGTPAIADSDDDDADKELLFDWRGKGPGRGMGLMKQSLGFKQVKRRSPAVVKSMVSKLQQGQVLGRDEKKKAEANRSLENVEFVEFVSLSDPDDVKTMISKKQQEQVLGREKKKAEVNRGLENVEFISLSDPDASKTMILKQQQVLGLDENKRAEVNRSLENVDFLHFVSLSDDDDDSRPTQTRRKDTKKVVSTSVKHADVVCLDSDSEAECPSVKLKGKDSAKLGKGEEPSVRRNAEKDSQSVEVTVVDTGPGPSEPYESRKDPSAPKLEESSNKTSELTKLDKFSPPYRFSASASEKGVGIRVNQVFASPYTNASSSRDEAKEIEYLSSEERVLNFIRILDGAGTHDDAIASPFRRRVNAAGRAAPLSVYDFKDGTVPESRVVSGFSPPAPGLVPRTCSNKGFGSTFVSSTKSSQSTAKEGQEKLKVASNIMIEDLTSSDDDDTRNPRCSGLSYKGERMPPLSRPFEMSDLNSWDKRTWSKDYSQSQEWPRPEKLTRVAEISVGELPTDEWRESGRLHDLGDITRSTGDECCNRTKFSTSPICERLGPGVRNSSIPLCNLAGSDDEDIEMQVPLKRKCIRSAVDRVVEEPSINVDVSDFDRTSLAVKRGKGRKRVDSEKTSSEFEAAKAVIELEKLEKQKGRQRDQEARNQLKEEDKKRRQEEIRKKKEEVRLQKEAAKAEKEAAKAEAAERKKIEQEYVKWRKGKFALENTTVYIDKRIIESKKLGPPLLQQFANKEYTYQVVTNHVEKTIIWTMKMPAEDSKAILDARESQDESISNSQLPLEEVEVKYVVVFLDAAEFMDMVAGDEVNNHISKIKKEHPGYTICYLVNNLTRYIQKKEQNQYRTGDRSWKRPNIEQVLAEFITHHEGVRSRLCIDENEMAEHVVGLTRSLAECPFKPKLTSLTINANGEHLSKNDPHRDVIKRDPWKKALAAIPNITGATVLAITRVYPTMRSLLNAYLDPSKTVLEKEFLLQDIVKEAALGSARAEGRRVGPVCSKRIYRLLMAQNGNLRTEAVEEGEDYFEDQQQQ